MNQSAGTMNLRTLDNNVLARVANKRSRRWKNGALLFDENKVSTYGTNTQAC